jgi:hypothetical protein
MITIGPAPVVIILMVTMYLLILTMVKLSNTIGRMYLTQMSQQQKKLKLMLTSPTILLLLLLDALQQSMFRLRSLQ